MLSLAPGVIPFGLIMGTVASSAQLSAVETIGLNVIVLAGASQLAAVELMTQNTPIFIVILTALVINLRFMMYSTSLAPHLKDLSIYKKVLCSYMLTDQAYAVSMAEYEDINKKSDRVSFYIGAAVFMCFIWHLSTLMGFLFGQFISQSWSLDFGVPLTFMALVIPMIKNRIALIVVLVSSIVSLVCHQLPMNLGLILAAVTSMLVGIWLQKIKKGKYV